LSRAAVELIEDRLRKGVVVLLARHGWRRERFLRDGQIATGRLWERTQPERLGLTFSRHALEFLLWIMTVAAKEGKSPWKPKDAEIATGDRFLCFLAMHCLKGSEPARVLAGLEFFQRDGLTRLAFADRIMETPNAIDFGPWTSGVGACIFEALQGPLAERWTDIERGKDRIGDPKALKALGRSQQTVLCAFSDAVKGAGRWDLARFLLRALANALPDQPRTWNLEALRLAERQEVQRATLAFVRHIAILKQWEMEARAVGYFDDGYAAAQLWKADWEAVDGDHLYERAQVHLHDIEPLQ
jgi:hypothetical protein